MFDKFKFSRVLGVASHEAKALVASLSNLLKDKSKVVKVTNKFVFFLKALQILLQLFFAPTFEITIFVKP